MKAADWACMDRPPHAERAQATGKLKEPEARRLIPLVISRMPHMTAREVPSSKPSHIKGSERRCIIPLLVSIAPITENRVIKPPTKVIEVTAEATEAEKSAHISVFKLLRYLSLIHI